MLTLALDTTGDFGSIALADESGVRQEVLLHQPQGFSGVIFPAISALLEQQDVTLRDIELFGAASGPGSFTGVRIGLAAAKGLAETLGRTVCAVSNLRALSTFGSRALRATVIDARRGEVFAAVYDAAGNAVVAEQVISFPKFLAQLSGLDLEWICQDFTPFERALAGTDFARIPVISAPKAIAGAIAAIAMKAGGSDPVSIEANYVRRSDAELLFRG
jgi:tRNA threonylcarbamoyladenosine biosynthesis protein TsaB